MNSVFMRYPGGKTRAVTFSYDDCTIHNKRLVELFDRYGVKCTFNLNCDGDWNYNYTGEELKELFLSKGHEVAVHGESHRANGNLRPAQGIKEVLQCRLELEEKCNCIIRGMAYPDTGITQMGNFGNYAEIKQYLTQLDIAYARTLGDDNNLFLLPEDFHAWMPTAHHDNPKIMEYIDEFLNLDFSKNAYHARRIPRLFYIWGHSHEFERKNNWEHMEKILKKLSGNSDIWYAANIEIYDYVEAYKSLKYSASGKMIYNPTLYTIHIDVDGTPYSINPGETIKIR